MDKGHNHLQNERCDELAVMASMQKKYSIDAFNERRKLKYCVF
jgi:ribonuclease HI